MPQKAELSPLCLRDGEVLNLEDLDFGDLEDLNMKDLYKTRTALQEYIREKNDKIIANMKKKRISLKKTSPLKRNDQELDERTL